MARDAAGTRISPANPDPAGADGTGKPVLVRRNTTRPVALVPHRLTAAERNRRISDLAYRRAEQRGFAPGGELDDWLEAEREVDAGRY